MYRLKQYGDVAPAPIRTSTRPETDSSMAKFSKYLAIGLTIVAVVAAVSWTLRNTIIQRISGPILENYDIEIIDVSLDALATNDASISRLELLHAKGTTIVLEGLTLPIGRSSGTAQKYSAKKVSVVTATRTEGEPFEMALLIDQWLSLTENLAGSEFSIAELVLPPYPVVMNLEWTLRDGQQELSASIESHAMSVIVINGESGDYAITYSIPGKPSASNVHTVSAHLQRSETGVALTGSASLELRAWEPLTKFAGVVPDAISLLSGSAGLKFDIDIPYDTNRTPSLTATLTPSAPLQVEYSNSPDIVTSIIVESGSVVNITATFPEVEWNLQEGQASLRVNYEEWRDIPVNVTKLSCQTGPRCSMNTAIDLRAADLPFGTAERFSFASAQTVTFPDDGVFIEIQRGATFSAYGLSVSDANIAAIDATLASSAGIELVDAGWKLAAESVDIKLDTASIGENLSLSAPLFLEKVLVSELDDVLSARFGVFAPSIHAMLNGQSVTLPGLKGDLSQENAALAFDLVTVGFHEDGSISGNQHLDSGIGEVRVKGVGVSFGSAKLSKRVSPWNEDWDLIAGIASIDAEASWALNEQESLNTGRLAMEITDLAGFYTDTVFTGLTTSINGIYDRDSGFSAAPSNIRIALIEMGLPIENISADYALDLNSLAAVVSNLKMSAFGGAITADPFSFRTDSSSNTVILRAESLDIAEILTLKEFQAIEVSGKIAATLPITFTADGVTVAGGALTGEEPGGVIRYLSGSAPGVTDGSSVGLVTAALSHFKYESLASEVSYNEAGDLVLKMKLVGRNPDMEGNRPVILNLSVENNVPQMLKSLQAARAVEDVLEKRVKK